MERDAIIAAATAARELGLAGCNPESPDFIRETDEVFRRYHAAIFSTMRPLTECLTDGIFTL